MKTSIFTLVDTDGTPVEGDSEDEPIKKVRIDWDDSQCAVINAPIDDFLLVEGGPGTGKSAVASARIAKLISEDGVEPDCIWLVNASRHEVVGLRHEIGTYLNSTVSAEMVNIATLDMDGWTVHGSYDEVAIPASEEDMDKLLGDFQSVEQVKKQLRDIRHLVVDGAHDITGRRAEIILAMMDMMGEGSGNTIFTDEAQAIHGNSCDLDFTPDGKQEETLSCQIRAFPGVSKSLELTVNHRAATEAMRQFCLQTREIILRGTEKYQVTFRNVDHCAKKKGQEMGEIQAVAKSPEYHRPRIDYEKLKNSQENIYSNELMLYRRRCDVLLASSTLRQNGINHFVHATGLPVSIPWWVGALLSDYSCDSLTLENMKNHCRLHFNLPPHLRRVHITAEDAWEKLFRIAGDSRGVVDMHKLRRRLGAKHPPAELCTTKIGSSGGVNLSTIHACRGSESDVVNLAFPQNPVPGIDADAEARVLFTGAARSRKEIRKVTDSSQEMYQIKGTGRCWRFWRKAGDEGEDRDVVRVQLELGLAGDITAEGLAGPKYFRASSGVRSRQNQLFGGSHQLYLQAGSDKLGSRYILSFAEQESNIIAVLSEAVTKDLKIIAAEIGKKRDKVTVPRSIRPLYFMGARTLVLETDDPECQKLHEPWRSSGIMLAPVFLGYPTILFPREKQTGE